MRILLDENMPNGLLPALRHLGHTVDSVGSLGLKGLDNGPLYQEVAHGYDLFFTKDREFAAQLRSLQASGPVKVVLTTLPQQPEHDFVVAFMEAFSSTNWRSFPAVGEWPV